MLENKLKFKIGIDGPAGAGKGTVGKALRDFYKCPYLDCGSGFRGFALGFNKLGISYDKFDINKVEGIDVDFINNCFVFNGVSVGDEIRTPEAGDLAAKFANHAAGFKPYVLDILKKIASTNEPKVVEGRNVAQIIMPEVPLLIYFHAPALIRAERRLKERELPIEKLQEILDGITSRDEGDYNNVDSPLMRPEIAMNIGAHNNPYHHIIDSGNMTPEEQFHEMLRLVDLTKNLLNFK